MSRLFWAAAIVGAVVVAVLLLWPERSPDRDAPAPPGPPPATHATASRGLDGDGGHGDGGPWQPHPDRAGLRRPTQQQ